MVGEFIDDEAKSCNYIYFVIIILLKMCIHNNGLRLGEYSLIFQLPPSHPAIVILLYHEFCILFSRPLFVEAFTVGMSGVGGGILYWVEGGRQRSAAKDVNCRGRVGGRTIQKLCNETNRPFMR